MKFLRSFVLACVALLAAPVVANAASAYYTPTATLTSLANFGTTSPLVLHAAVQSATIGTIQGNAFYSWQVTCGGVVDGQNYVAATGVAVGCWKLEGVAGANNTVECTIFAAYGGVGGHHGCIGINPYPVPAHNFASSYDSGTGLLAFTHPSTADISGLGTVATKNLGASVADPGSGSLEALFPFKALVTGASHVFVAADLQYTTRRSNSGSAMSDTFPVSSTTGLANGVAIYIGNSDATATITITAGSGTTFSAGSTTTVGPGRGVEFVYDTTGGTPTWRAHNNDANTLLAPNNLGDVGSPTAALANIGGAPLASPTFTGDPKAPTPTVGDSDTSIATTAFVATSFAPLASPTFTGDPKAPTPSTGDNDTSIATTAFVKAQAYATLASPALTGSPTAPTPGTSDNSTLIATTAFVKAQGYLTVAPVTSVFGRTGAVVAAANDYSFSQLSGTFVSAQCALAAAGGVGGNFGCIGITPYPVPANNFASSYNSGTGLLTFTQPALANLSDAATIALLASPTFTGDPKAPTPTVGDSDTSIATTAFVATSFAPLASPTFTGTINGAAETLTGFLSANTFTIGNTSSSAQFMIAGTYTSANNNLVLVNGIQAGSGTGTQSALTVSETFNPSGASIGTLNGVNVNPRLTAANTLAPTAFVSISGQLTTLAAYAPTIPNGYDFYAQDFTQGGTNPLTAFQQFFAAGSSNGNGVTAGTITNYGFRYNSATAAAGAGGTINNYGFHATIPSGSGAGTTTNYGLRVTGSGGSGGGGTTTNWGVFADTAANNAFNGNTRFGSTTAPTHAVDVTGTLDATTLSQGGTAIASTFAALASPTFTGDPKAPTPSTGDNDTSIATTAFVKAQNYLTATSATSGSSPLSGDGAGGFANITVDPSLSFISGTLACSTAAHGAVGSNLGCIGVSPYPTPSNYFASSYNAGTGLLTFTRPTFANLDPASTPTTLPGYGVVGPLTAPSDSTFASTSLGAPTGLGITAPAGKTENFRLVIFFDADVTSGSKFTMSGTATITSTIFEVDYRCDSGAAITPVRVTTWGTAAGQAGCTSGRAIIEGSTIVNAGGTITPQAATNTGTTTLTVRKGSTAEYWQTN